MGGFFGIGNSSAKTDRGRALGGWNAMWDVWSKAMGGVDSLRDTGTAATRSGMQSIDFGNDFWKSVLSGDKAGTAAAAAPATNAAAGMVDQARTQQAQMGTSRGGGTAGTNIDATRQAQGDVTDALLGLAPTAAAQIGQSGEVMAGVGSRNIAMALQELGLSQETANAIVSTSMQSRTQSHEMSPARIGESAILSLIGL